MLIFTNQQVSIANGYLVFPENLGIEKVKTRLPYSTKLNQVRIIPKGTGYVCEIVHETVDEEGEINMRWCSRRDNENRIAGLDFGLRNIAAIANNVGIGPIVIKGDMIKSINQFYNKKRAEIQSIYDKQKIKTGTAIEKLTDERNRKIKDAMHKISRYIINYCKIHKIGTIVIGYNEDWKQEVEIGRRNNQNFVSIPYYLLLRMIQDEAHTSKCSFLDNESIEHNEKYLGKRTKRGIFRSALGMLINADVQGALNIIRKAVPKAFINVHADGIEGVGLHPKRIDIKKILSFEEVCYA